MATANKLEILTVRVASVRYTGEGFSVYSGEYDNNDVALDGYDYATVAVKQFSGPVKRGQRWTLAGKRLVDPKYGPQFSVSFAALGVPRNAFELEQMLSSDLLEGWSWRDYRALEQALGAEGALQACLSRSANLAAVPGITDDMIATLTDALRRGDSMAGLYAQLADWGVGGKLSDALVKYFGFGVLERLSEDPYKDILHIKGYGWQHAEHIANTLGITANDPRRVKAGLACAVHEATWERGHTWMTRFEAVKAGSELLRCAYPIADAQLQACLDDGDLVQDSGRLYPKRLHQAEGIIADAVASAIDRVHLVPLDMIGLSELPGNVSDKQWEAVIGALAHGISLLTGGPGVGKTTALRTLVEAAREHQIPVTCMAPTGKAASRMSQATGYPGTTIHSRLKITPDQIDSDDDNDQLSGLVIIDEVSMLDTQLAAQVFKHLSPSARLLLVGDPDQLPSVGPGAVLRDLLSAKVISRTHLEKVYRNEAGIAQNAARIRAGQSIQAMDDVQLMEAQSPDHAAQLIVRVIARLLRDGVGREDILVLTPTNAGPSGRYTLNQVLQPMLNPAQPGSGITQKVRNASAGMLETRTTSQEIRPGDRVMVIKNDSELKVFNGQIGTVVEVRPPKSITVDIEGQQIRFSGEDKGLLTLAYAITGHKSQGSEAPIVIAPIFPSRVLSREWLYTVLTRSKERAFLIGDLDAIQGCLAVQRATERQTGLVGMIHARLAAAEMEAISAAR